MVPYKIGGVGVATLLAAAALAPLPLEALTMRECSAAYRSAQQSGKLGGMSWQEFRKARCGPGAAPTAVPKPGPAPGGSAYLPSGAVFPSTVSPKYGDETPGKARMHTCLDQYRVNKASNGNGGLKWIQKGGGYYSECNKRLKARKG
ncbi:MAG TPA: hypothetical protein VH913_23910 [Hyphomicrobiaceae bacterium]|jgi:hypothetical protein